MFDTHDGVDDSVAGRHTLLEVLSQPQCWRDCLANLHDSKELAEIVEQFNHIPQWIFVGCGSSYYIALCAAASWRMITGRKAWAVPASEVLLYPDLVLTGASNLAAVLISRSGKTSEVVKAAEFFRARQISTIALSCASEQPLGRAASASIILSRADEKSMVMTRSFTAMLLALQYIAASLADKVQIVNALHQLPSAVVNVFAEVPEHLRRFVAGNKFEDYVCLGQGMFYGLACESALKLTEMSCSYGQAFHTLEFRHGPKSIVAPETLVMFLLSEAGYQPELEVLEEIKSLGGTTVVIAPKTEPQARAAADLFIEISCDLPELVKAASYVFVPQLLALYTGLKKGLNPDAPRHLSRVVMLNDESALQHATF